MRKLLVALAIWGLTASTTFAGYTYAFRFDPFAAQATPGVPMSLDLYLDETSSDLIGSPLRLSDAGIGLVTGNANVTLNTAPGAFNSATPSFIDDGILTSASGLASNSTASLSQTTFAFPAPGFSVGTASGNTASLKLGSFSFTPTSLLDGTITTDLLAGTGDLVLGDGSDLFLNATPVSQGLYNFGAVPEPASFCTAAVLGLSAACFARRKRKNLEKPALV